MNNKNALATSLALTIASGAAAAPPGWVLVADSEAQFSGTQGQDGWWYLFDRGEGTAIEQMPYFTPYNATPDNGAYAWCPEPTAGFGGSFCMLHRTWSHTNAAYACGTPEAGLQRPIRAWVDTTDSRLLVEVNATLGGTNTSAIRFDAIADGTIVRSWLSNYGSVPTIDAIIEFAGADQLSFRLDPVDGCAADGCHDLSIRIYTPDCDGNGSADYLEIATSPGLDADGNLVLDSCECLTHPELPACCPADLTRDGQVNGADIGAVVAFWGPNPAFPAADINGDGTVNGSDLATVLASWGPCGG